MQRDNPFLTHSRTGSAKAGPQTARLVPCTKSQFHGHLPGQDAHFKGILDKQGPSPIEGEAA